MNVITTSRIATETAGDGLQMALQWFDISQGDCDLARELSGSSETLARGIVSAFYDHMLSHPEASHFFESAEQLERLKTAQTRYFRELVESDLTEEYVEDRRRIGQVHEQIGVTPTLYIGAYSYYLAQLGNRIFKMMPDDADRAIELIMTLMKLAHFDMALALETYVSAREETIQSRERELSELPTPVLQLRPGLLLVPFVGTLDSFRARSMTVHLLERIRDLRAEAVVLDITGVSNVDSAVANHLIQAMTAARLMGASSVLTGVSADVAQSLVKIGVTAEELNTAGDLEQGIELAERILSE